MKTAQVLALTVLLVSPCLAKEPAARQGKEAIVTGNNTFALDLYGRLRGQKGNLFFSPYSISTALAMACGGARGNTEKQMAQVLHFPSVPKETHAGLKRLQSELDAVEKKGDVALSVANALWAEKDYKFLKAYLDLVKECYDAALNHVDFKTACEAARKEINAWVEKRTKDKIKDLLKPGVVDATTRLVLTNAIYFKGAWDDPFEKECTRPKPFHLSSRQKVDVPTMVQSDEFGYAETDALQALEMPYRGEELSMVVLLPKKVDGLSDLEAKLTAANLTAWLGQIRKTEVVVFLPKFKLTCELGLAQTLGAMGMPDAFAYGPADFSGMDGTRELFISAVIHKAFVDVNERGTEAAAATAVAVAMGAAPGDPPPKFRADHPFLFLIRHRPSGSILFLGRLSNPTQ